MNFGTHGFPKGLGLSSGLFGFDLPSFEVPIRFWTPADITTQLWLDASDSATITLVSGAVSQWSDKSGNNRHLTQSNSALRPTVTANSIGSLSGINFFSNKGLTNDTSMVAQFVICVTKSQNTTWANYHAHLCGNNDSIRIGGMRESSNTGFHFNVFPSAVWEDGISKSVAGSGFNTIQSPHIIGYTAASGRGNPVLGFCIGNFNASSSGGAGVEHETVVFSSAPTTDIRQKTEGYLAHKWGLTANLPADHPYKTNPPTE